MVVADASTGCIERAIDVFRGHSSFFVAQHWVSEGHAIYFSSQKFSIIFTGSRTVLHVSALMVEMVLLQELLETLIASHFHEFELSLIPHIHSARSDE